MKPEHLYPAPFAEPRHPRCIRATPVTGVPSTLADQQAARILELEGKLEAALGREHDLAGRATKAEGALQLLAMHFGLPETTLPREVLAEAMRRMR